jgi:hypothetical protein
MGYFGFFSKTVNFVKTEYAKFVKTLMPGTIVLVRRTDGKGISGMITSATGALFSHGETYFGLNGGQNGVVHETVSADGEVGKIIVTSLDRYGNDEYQMMAFTFTDLTPREFSILKNRVYSRVGEKYDYAAAFHVVAPLVPDDPKLVNCSELIAWAYMYHPLIREVVGPGVNWQEAVPGDLFDGLINNHKVKIATFNFKLYR